MIVVITLFIFCKFDCILFSSILKPHNGHSGDWSQFSMTSCNNDFINGAAIEIYPKGGTFVDERGATNLKMTCTNGKLMEIYNNDKSLVFYFDLSVLTNYILNFFQISIL